MKYYLRFTSLLILVFFISSCSSNDELYSCDPDADAWVKENLSKVKNLNRKEWQNIEKKSFRKAAYVAFTPVQKQLFWIKKIEETLMLSWNSKEKEHLLSLLSYIKNRKSLFEMGMTDEEEIWSYKWLKYGEETLNWSKEVLYNIVMDGDSMNNAGEIVNLDNIQLKQRSESYDPTCNCRTDKTDCSSKETCKSAATYYCNMTYCGFLWLSVCNGKCV